MHFLLALFLFAQIPMPFAIFDSGTTGVPGATASPTATPNPNQVAKPVIVPSSGTTPLSVTITESTAGATVFYTLSSGGTNPTHSGATPLGSTRIYSGTFNSGSGTKTVRALGYKSGLADSTIASATYDTPF